MKRETRESDECDSCNRAVDLPAYRAEVKRLRRESASLSVRFDALAKVTKDFMLEHTMRNCGEWRTGGVCECPECEAGRAALEPQVTRERKRR